MSTGPVRGALTHSLELRTPFSGQTVCSLQRFKLAQRNQLTFRYCTCRALCFKAPFLVRLIDIIKIDSEDSYDYYARYPIFPQYFCHSHPSSYLASPIPANLRHQRRSWRKNQGGGGWPSILSLFTGRHNTVNKLQPCYFFPLNRLYIVMPRKMPTSPSIIATLFWGTKNARQVPPNKFPGASLGPQVCVQD